MYFMTWCAKLCSRKIGHLAGGIAFLFAFSFQCGLANHNCNRVWDLLLVAVGQTGIIRGVGGTEEVIKS